MIHLLFHNNTPHTCISLQEVGLRYTELDKCRKNAFWGNTFARSGHELLQFLILIQEHNYTHCYTLRIVIF